MLIGSRIKELRKKNGLTQEELGEKINVTKVSISCYENGSRSPDLETFELLVDALNTTTDFLLGRDKYVVDKQNNSKVFMTNIDLEIMKEIKKNPELMKLLKLNPKRSVEYIVKKVR